MRNLILLRHAKSDWGQSGVDDFDRPISKRGRKAIHRMGNWIKCQQPNPEWVICSPSQRTRQTLEGLCESISIPDKSIDYDQRLYLADLPALLEVLGDSPADRDNILLIGHNPGMEELLRYLCNDELSLASDGKLMPTATWARIALSDNWCKLKAKAGKLLTIMRPRELPKEFL